MRGDAATPARGRGAGAAARRRSERRHTSATGRGRGRGTETRMERRGLARWWQLSGGRNLWSRRSLSVLRGGGGGRGCMDEKVCGVSADRDEVQETVLAREPQHKAQPSAGDLCRDGDVSGTHDRHALRRVPRIYASRRPQTDRAATRYCGHRTVLPSSRCLPTRPFTYQVSSSSLKDLGLISNPCERLLVAVLLGGGFVKRRTLTRWH